MPTTKKAATKKVAKKAVKKTTKKVDPKSTEVAPEKKVEQIAKDITKYEKGAGNLVIDSEDGYQGASAFLGEVKGRINRVKEIHTEYVQPLKDHVKKLDALFKEPIKSYEAVEAQVKRAMADYRIAEDKRQAEEQARLNEEHEKAQKEAEKTGDVPVPTPPPVAPKMAATVESGDTKTTSSKVVKFEVTDPNKLPKKLRDAIYELAVKKGLADQIVRKEVSIHGMNAKITGVRVYEDYQISASA